MLTKEYQKLNEENLKYWKNKFKQALLLYQKKPNITHLFTLIHAGYDLAASTESWGIVEDVMEETMGERPNWQEFKQIFHNLSEK